MDGMSFRDEFSGFKEFVFVELLNFRACASLESAVELLHSQAQALGPRHWTGMERIVTVTPRSLSLPFQIYLK